MKLPHDFGKYELRRELGRGAFARVFLAWHKALEKDMVLKILRPEIREEPELLERFRVEAKTMAAMSHDNIVRVTDMDEWDGSMYIAMEHVEGMDLEDWLKKHGQPPLEIVLHMLGDVCRGLAAAHARTIHRDIKPANMIFSAQGRVKLMDFGLARRIEDVSTGLTQVGVVLGTVAYMSPEQDSGEVLDRRTDIFSVGVVAYRLLTGDRPFPGQSSSEIRAALRTREARPIHEFRKEIPADVSGIVHSMLEKDRERRCQRIEEAGAVFQRAAARLGFSDGRALLERYYADPEAVTRELDASRNRRLAAAAAAEPDPMETVVDPNALAASGSGVSRSSARSGTGARATSSREAADSAGTSEAPRRGVPMPVLVAVALVVAAGAVFGLLRWMDGRRHQPEDSNQTAGIVTPANGAVNPPADTPPVVEPHADPAAAERAARATADSLKRVAAAARKAATPAATTASSIPASTPSPPSEPVPPPRTETLTYGTLVVDLKPDVPVYVDDDRVSITGYKQLSLPRGTHVVRATYNNFEFKRTVQVEAGRTTTLQYDLVMATTGSVRLTLESDEGWGSVVIDGAKRREQAPGVVEGLSPGTHSISVEGPQYVLDGPAIKVEVVAGQVIEVPIRLKSRGGSKR